MTRGRATPEATVARGAFAGLGLALRWLRTRQQKRQYEVAAAAGITKAMLSAYETDKQRPTLETLEKLMSALEIDLKQLFEALQLITIGLPQGPPMVGDGGSPTVPISAASDARSSTASNPHSLTPRSRLATETNAFGELQAAFARWLQVIRAQIPGDPS